MSPARAAIIQADATALPLRDGCVQMACTSPPYWAMRCYGVEGQLGLEATPEEYVAKMVLVFREVKRVLRDDGVLFLNIGDTYNQGPKGAAGGVDRKQEARRFGVRPNEKGVPGLKAKDRVGIPHMLAFALRADGWYWRDEIVWHKPNPMPESVTDRCTKSHEFIFVFSKSPRYFYDADAIREPVTSTGGASFGPQTKISECDRTADGGHARVEGGYVASRKLESAAQRNHPLGRNKRSVWTISTQSCPEAHFATFPIKLPLMCIKAGTSEKGCCPKCGAPWRRVVERTAMVIDRSSRTHPMGRTRTSGTMISPPTSVTTGWKPTCACDAGDPVPCLVLDNFNGAGTTGLAAIQLGRSYIGTELKREYIDITLARFAKARDHKPKKRRGPRPVKGEPTLFGVEAA